MAAHRNYSLNIAFIVRVMRKAGYISSKDEGVKAVISAIKRILDRDAERYLHTMEIFIQLEEFFWLTTGQKVYFLEDAELARSIQRGSYNIQNAAPLYSGEPETFVLMLPPGFAINGSAKGGGAMVTIAHHEQREVLYKNFFNAVDHPQPAFHFQGEIDAFTLCINYQETTDKPVYCRAVVSQTMLETILKMDTVEDYRAFLAANNQFDYLFGAELLPAEQAYQFELVRLVAGFLVYRHAMPERIREGLPSNTKGHEATHPIYKKPKMMLVKSPKREGASPQGHYRTWHFRQLMADRFYRGEHAAKEKGSRIVFVSDAFVSAKDAEVYTVED